MICQVPKLALVRVPTKVAVSALQIDTGPEMLTEGGVTHAQFIVNEKLVDVQLVPFTLALIV